jgi:hypothetical protein
MSWMDKFCESPELTKAEQSLCYELASDFWEILTDLDKKGYLRSELKEKGEEGRVNSEYVIENLRNVTGALNKFSSLYVDKAKQKKFIELNKPYGMTKTDLNYLFYSESVFVFLQNIEAFRAFLLFIMKLPIRYDIKGKRKEIDSKIGLGTLLKSLKKLGIKKADTLSDKRNDIDYNLRNGLSHCLFWLDEQGDSEHSEPHLHYSEDITFKKIKWISFDDLRSKTRKQAIYTNCLLSVIGDWFF